MLLLSNGFFGKVSVKIYSHENGGLFGAAECCCVWLTKKILKVQFIKIKLVRNRAYWVQRHAGGGAYGIRTRDLHTASVARSQLRQCPNWFLITVKHKKAF